MKKVLAVLLTAVMVISTVVVSPAAPLAGSGKYERPEPVREDTVKTTGTWTKDDKGFWSLTSENRKVTDGWYYANMLNTSTEYRWYHFDANGIMSTGWVNDKKDAGIWYYAGETKDRTEGSMRTGWITDPQDGQRYYMDPATGMMSHGWVKIDNAWYYFAERQYAKRSWTANANGYWTAQAAAGHSYGSMYRSEMTPDGYYVDGRGEWRQSSGSSSRSNPVPTPTPTPTPEPVMTAKATTSTAQYAGQSFNKDGLKVTVYKDGKVYDTVTLPNDKITNVKVTVNREPNGTLAPGSNEVSIGFLYYDPAKPDVLIGQSMTTEVFTVDGITYTVTFDANGHGTAPAQLTDVAEGAKITAPAKPTEELYVFGGWYKEAACDNAWDFDKDTVTEDITLYAKWTVASFTVKAAEGTDPAVTAEFSPGLLYWDGTDSKFKFEADQTAFTVDEGNKWDPDHVNHFYWSKDKAVAVAETYEDLGRTATDTFFAESLKVDGESWRTLSKAEWDYLINGRTVNGGKGYGKTCNWGTYKDVNGLIIAHDTYAGGFTGDNWVEEAIADGCVFLPAAGYRNGTNVNYVGNYGRYWSATPHEGYESSAYYLNFDDGGAVADYSNRYYGRCVRLVR